MPNLTHVQQAQIARRDFVQRVALAGGGLALAGAAGCGAAETGLSGAAPLAEDRPPAAPAEFTLFHEEYGEGAPVVFAHGAGGTHMSWWRQIPTFSQEFRCVAG